MAKIRCNTYNMVKEFDNAEQAKAFFYEGMKYCEGCEQERYVRIYTQLMEGHTYCTDNENVTEEDLKRIEQHFAEIDK